MKIQPEIKKEAGKAVLASGAVMIGGPIPAVIASVLGVGVEFLSLLGKKRTEELFDTKEFSQKIVDKILVSEDFASFVYDVWRRYSAESSNQRRRYLKRLLTSETYSQKNNFENFSRVEFIIQNASISSLRLAKFFYSDHVRQREIDPNDSSSRLIGYPKLFQLMQNTEVEDLSNEAELFMNELSSYSIVKVSHGGIGGPYMEETSFGKIVLGYIND